MKKLFTIGYATKPLNVFIQQLQQHGVHVVADIRSVPYSKVFEDFHKESIQATLQQHQIRYVYLGDELGPRSKDERHYDESGQVQFHLLMNSPLFEEGIERLKTGLTKGYSIALMCAEKDAATCHRSLLVGYYLNRTKLLESSAVELLHITHDGDVETQAALEKRVMSLHDRGDDLFLSEEERYRQAYEMQLKNTSYRRTS